MFLNHTSVFSYNSPLDVIFHGLVCFLGIFEKTRVLENTEFLKTRVLENTGFLKTRVLENTGFLKTRILEFLKTRMRDRFPTRKPRSKGCPREKYTI